VVTSILEKTIAYTFRVMIDFSEIFLIITGHHAITIHISRELLQSISEYMNLWKEAAILKIY
jgi:hypothetical protein